MYNIHCIYMFIRYFFVLLHFIGKLKKIIFLPFLTFPLQNGEWIIHNFLHKYRENDGTHMYTSIYNEVNHNCSRKPGTHFKHAARTWKFDIIHKQHEVFNDRNNIYKKMLICSKALDLNNFNNLIVNVSSDIAIYWSWELKT